MRGGTSKAIMFHARDLPPNRDAWSKVFTAPMGSPHPNGRQLDGMGVGVSSLSKVCVLAPSERDDADIDYTFAQILRAVMRYLAGGGWLPPGVQARRPLQKSLAMQRKVIRGKLGDDAVLRLTSEGELLYRMPMTAGGKERQSKSNIQKWMSCAARDKNNEGGTP